VKFQVLDILPNIENPVTGRLVSTAERFAQALQSARRAEELGFDAVALGERHAGHFLSSGITVLLGAIAATTSRVRIMTGVSVLSILDPSRVAEDYATVDQLSRGRLELVIDKGNELRQLPMFGVEQGQQWEQLAEKYEPLRRLWREEKVTCSSAITVRNTRGTGVTLGTAMSLPGQASCTSRTPRRRLSSGSGLLTRRWSPSSTSRVTTHRATT
jgi:alkanesulfonate monooxygenase SsuD/methylene tetrahydromethanopterin reductase-like flavin-dependent oxidoreductase (luciferase family)